MDSARYSHSKLAAAGLAALFGACGGELTDATEPPLQDVSDSARPEDRALPRVSSEVSSVTIDNLMADSLQAAYNAAQPSIVSYIVPGSPSGTRVQPGNVITIGLAARSTDVLQWYRRDFRFRFTMNPAPAGAPADYDSAPATSAGATSPLTDFSVRVPVGARTGHVTLYHRVNVRVPIRAGRLVRMVLAPRELVVARSAVPMEVSSAPYPPETITAIFEGETGLRVTWTHTTSALASVSAFVVQLWDPVRGIWNDAVTTPPSRFNVLIARRFARRSEVRVRVLARNADGDASSAVATAIAP